MNIYYKLIIILSFFMLGCITVNIEKLSLDDGYALIKSNHKDAEWEGLIKNSNIYKTRYPYSIYNTEIELLVADSYFVTQKYPESIAIYEEFLRKNAKNSNRALAAWRIALAYDAQSSEDADREQVFTKKTLSKYIFFLETFPTDENVEQAKNKIRELNLRLANQIMFIANFYMKKDMYSSALLRYLFLIKNYPLFTDLVKISKEKASILYLALADELEKDPKSDKSQFFVNNTPTQLRQNAKEILTK